jgi:hypothetical protein
MKQFSVPRLALVCVLSLALLSLDLPVSVHAGVIGTDALVTTARDADMAYVRSQLDRDDVRQKMQEMGVAPDAVDGRIAGLTDQELHRLAGDMQKAPAGGDGILVLIGAVFVVLIILDLMGVTHIFRRT